MSRRSSVKPAVATADLPAPSGENAPRDPYPPADSLPAPTPGSLPAPPDLAPDEAFAYETMSDPLRLRALEMKECMLKEIRGLMASRYKLGSIVADIKRNPAVYGSISDIQLAAFFGEAGKTVYAEARRIRERYSPERFQQIVNAVNPENGAVISYKHLALLLRVEDDALADEMLEHCLSAALSTRELADYVDEKVKQAGAARRRPAGRRRPKSFLSHVERIAASSEDVQS